MGSYLLDNSIFSPLIRADDSAIRFARRNELYIESTVLNEAGKTHSPSAIQDTVLAFGITEVGGIVQDTDLASIMTALRIVIVKPDVAILAAANKHGLGLITGDNKLFRRAVRLKHRIVNSGLGAVKFRLFIPSLSVQERILGYRRARRYIQLHFPHLNAHRFTGGR